MQDGLSPLWLASRNGYTDIVKALLQQGADAESKDKVIIVACAGYKQTNVDHFKTD